MNATDDSSSIEEALLDQMNDEGVFEPLEEMVLWESTTSVDSRASHDDETPSDETSPPRITSYLKDLRAQVDEETMENEHVGPGSTCYFPWCRVRIFLMFFLINEIKI